jgi:hypothetical protein
MFIIIVFDRSFERPTHNKLVHCYHLANKKFQYQHLLCKSNSRLTANFINKSLVRHTDHCTLNYNQLVNHMTIIIVVILVRSIHHLVVVVILRCMCCCLVCKQLLILVQHTLLMHSLDYCLEQHLDRSHTSLLK